jgi:LysM domain-containing protein
MSTRSIPRFVGSVAAVAAVVVGLPAFLVAVAVERFGHVSPMHGLNAPWRWTVDAARSWGRRLGEGLDSSAELVDLFFRVALVIGWMCTAVLIYTLVTETMFQLRHGMPSAHHRRFGGLGSLGCKLATALVAILPLAVSTTPTLAGPLAARPAANDVRQRLADFDEPYVAIATDGAVLAAAVPTAGPDAGSGWSLLEVRRGDSVWAIAERIANGHNVATIAQQIVDANLGAVMNDGHRFSTPALIEPGWLLNVPTAAQPAVEAQVVEPQLDTYVVEPGDSYWKIAEDHLEPSVDAGRIAAYTVQLMDLNVPLLGYPDERLIRPGDVVQLVSDATPEVAPIPAVVVPSGDVTPVAADPLPAIVVDVPPDAEAPPAAVELPPPTTVIPSTRSESPAREVIDSTVAAVVDDGADDGIPVKRGLTAAVLLSAGAIAALEARRRQQLRSAHVGARLLPPTEQAVETETLLRSLSTADRLARIDLALRCAAPDLARQQARALAAEIADDGEIRLYTDRPATLVAQRWLLDIEAGAWRLPANVSLVDLADDARRSNQPCPALIHIGESAGGHLFVDLEAVGLLSVEAVPAVAASIVRCAAASLAVSPFAESSRVFTVGLEVEARLGSLNVESHDSLAAAVEAVRTTVGSITSATSGAVTTFALRAAAHGGEAWEPSLLLAVGDHDVDELASLVALAGGGGRGVGVMIDRRLPGSGVVLRADDGDFVLEPLGRRVTPIGLSVADVSAVDNLLDAAERPLVADLDDLVEAPPIAGDEFIDRPHELVVHVLGQVAVQSADGEPVGFERSKAQELVVWLSQHRHRPTRTSARTALWDLAVRDATFSNVVSDARRAMAKVVPPSEGQEWIGRTMNEDLPLHDLVVTDTELLAERVSAARCLDAPDAIAVLRPGVALINGMPFAGTSYLWPDAEGTTSALVMLATSAAAELASHYLAIGDVDGVFWATGQGLKVLAGHEELIALRMRAHAHRGDLAGVRSEWESYERAINADTWAAAEPSPKLVKLRRDLLSPSLAS